MHISSEIISNAITNAAKGHCSKPEVVEMLANRDRYISRVADSIETGSYIDQLSYHEFETTNSNGKHRHIEQPSLFARILQHVFILLISQLYEKLDPHISFNCKIGYGIAASDKSKSVIHRIKSVMYDRRDLHSAVHIDQRKCYDHMTRKLFRKSLKLLTDDRELIDFGVNVTFHGKSFPIGTPTSPLAHHIIMLSFDRWLGSIPGPKLRYADDCLLFFHTKEEANEAKWRIKNFWWYEYNLLSKRENSRIVDIDKEPLSFCGMVFSRIPDRNKLSHGKGYVRPRKNIRHASRKCRTDSSWSSYFGILSKTDSYETMRLIEEKMDFSELTQKIKISRQFDAEPISLQELAKSKFSIYDFEIRCAKNKETGNMEPNWARMLVGMEELVDGVPTGKWLRYCAKTESEGMVRFLAELKKLNDSGESVLPLKNCEIENAAGYIFKGSTNREKYCSRDNIRLPNSSIYK